jgi:hypothetical protein
MIRRLFILVALSALCFGTTADAADLPSTPMKRVPHLIKTSVKPKKAAAVKLKKALVQPIDTKPTPASEDSQVVSSKDKIEPIVIEPKANEINMLWLLDPLIASADGQKKEGSSSVESTLVVVEPGYLSLPYMVIELTGHIIKTANTTARLDVHIGDVYRTASWKPEEVKSGKFKIELKAPMQEGKLPTNFLVSAVAIVTKDAKDGVVMVSLERVLVRLGKVRTAETQ